MDGGVTQDSFLGRWSRRKRAALRTPEPPAPPPPDLPPVAGLGTASDYTPFLQRGVEPEVQSAALGRAWATDQRIAAFRGMGEYDWDFNAPGYGKLAAADDVARLVAAVLAPAADTEEVEPEQAADAVVPAPPEAPAPVEQTASEPPPLTRRHGSARPV